MEEHVIPDIIVGRLPRYLQTLEQMAQAEIQTTCSKELGERLGISAAQIRKDLSQFGEFGKQGTGYSIGYLVKKLKEILNVDCVWDMVLVGAGDLGHAIARYQGFTKSGFKVALIFDNNPEMIGKKVGEYIVEDAADLVRNVKRSGIKVAMITVPVQAAQSVADQLVEAGIKAILTYAPTILNLPPGVRVQYIDPGIHLQRMTYYLE
jgi:redox-sensing transcriptional repressor